MRYVSELVVGVRVHGPQELAQQCLGEDLLDLDFILLAPGHSDAGVIVVGLTGALGDLLILISLPQ